MKYTFSGILYKVRFNTILVIYLLKSKEMFCSRYLELNFMQGFVNSCILSQLIYLY